MNTQTAGVWVKASNELPPVNVKVVIRDSDGTIYQDQAKSWDKDVTNYEWLDESIPTLTIQQALEVWESALDWDYNMKEEHDYKRTYFLNKFGFDIDKSNGNP